MILTTKSEPCYCCEGDECCAYSSTPSFSPPSGFSLESINCQNTNPNNCVGRQDCTIKLSKPANPGMTCTLEPCKHSSRCNSGTNTPAAVSAAFFNQILGLLVNYQQATAYSGPSGQGCFSPCTPPSPLTSACCFDLLYGDTYATETCVCPPNGSGSQRKMLFEYPNINSGYLGCINENTYCMNNYWATELNNINGALASSPFKMVTTPATGYTCEWWLWGLSVTRNLQATNNVCSTRTYTTCWESDNICKHRVQWIQLHCAVRCNQNPCSGVTGPSWPLQLDCTCDSEYSPPDPSSKPACGLLLYDSSGPSYENDKCIWTAKYGGVLAAGVVDCDSTPENDDCICCGEGGGS